MESRKLISFGSSSYVISVPKSWVKKNKLEKGSSLYLNEKQDELVISANSEQKKKTKEIQIDVANKSVERIQAEIVASYINNYDIIEVRNAKEDNMLQIKEIVRSLAGLEIMEQTQSKLVVKDLINIREVSIKTLIRRMDIIIRSMFDDLVIHLNENLGNTVKSFYQRDTDVNRLYFLVRRVMTAALEDPNIAKILETNPIELVFDWEIVIRLEKIGDQLKRMSLRLNKIAQENRQYKFVSCILEELKTNYLNIMKAYYYKDKNIAYDVELSNAKRIEKCNDFIQHLEGSNGINRNDVENLVILSEKFKDMSTSIKNIARVVVDNGLNIN